MSLDERVTREIRRQAGTIDGSRLPGADAVVAKARRRVRRRRVGGGAALVVLLVFGASVVFAATDPDDETDLRTENPTTIAPATTIEQTTTEPTTTATTPPNPTRAVATCSPPVLFTDMPDGWQNVVHQGAGGGTGAPGAHISGGQGRYIDIVHGDAMFRIVGSDGTALPSTETLALPALGVDASMVDVHEGLAATIPVATPCGDEFQLVGYGIADADFEQVLLGMRPEFQCSASGLDDTTPASLAPSSGLPENVGAAADAVRRAAIACDFGRLGEMAVTGIDSELPFVIEGDDGPALDIAAADHWRSLEANGEPILRRLAGILAMEPYRFDFEGEATGYYFPKYCDDRRLTDADWTSLEPIYGADWVAEFRTANAQTEFLRDKYIGGHCAGFQIDDGHWSGYFPLLP